MFADVWNGTSEFFQKTGKQFRRGYETGLGAPKKFMSLADRTKKQEMFETVRGVHMKSKVFIWVAILCYVAALIVLAAAVIIPNMSLLPVGILVIFAGLVFTFLHMHY